MNRKLLAGLAAVALAFSLTACNNEPQQCTDRNGTQYVCEEDDDDDSGFIPFIMPWNNSHSSKPKTHAPSYKAPTYKAPSYKAPTYKAPSYRAPSFRSK